MNKGRYILFIASVVIVIVILLIVPRKQSSHTGTLENMYKGNIMSTDMLQILYGSNGETVYIMDQELIKEWILEVKDLSFEYDHNQEGRDGLLYQIQFYEGKENHLTISTNKYRDKYIVPISSFIQSIDQLLETNE